MRWQVGKEGGVLERDARAAGGEAGEKADGQAGEARGRAAGMGRDGRGGLTAGWAALGALEGWLHSGNLLESSYSYRSTELAPEPSESAWPPTLRLRSLSPPPSRSISRLRAWTTTQSCRARAAPTFAPCHDIPYLDSDPTDETCSPRLSWHPHCLLSGIARACAVDGPELRLYRPRGSCV